MNTILKFTTFCFFMTMHTSCFSTAEAIKVANNNLEDGVITPSDPSKPDDTVIVTPDNLMTKSLDELKDMCLNPQKYNLQSPLFNLNLTGVLTWSKWIKKVVPVYMVESQKMNAAGSFTKSGRLLDGSEWKISNGELSDSPESNTSCFVAEECVEFVKHTYTRNLMNKMVECNEITKASSVEELYGLTLADFKEITNAIPLPATPSTGKGSGGAIPADGSDGTTPADEGSGGTTPADEGSGGATPVEDSGSVTPVGFTDQPGETFPVACPQSIKPEGLESCTVSH
ncbi:MAG: hypothetical protein HQK52_13250 [Oligoflexia bacterium]|nr:hypothetical protein [Oligoflexia bacterium]